MSPSAEVQGHRAGGPLDQSAASGVAAVTGIEPVGTYAVRLIFDDLHSTGIFTWDYLHELGVALMTRNGRSMRRSSKPRGSAATGRDRHDGESGFA